MSIIILALCAWTPCRSCCLLSLLVTSDSQLSYVAAVSQCFPVFMGEYCECTFSGAFLRSNFEMLSCFLLFYIALCVVAFLKSVSVCLDLLQWSVFFPQPIFKSALFAGLWYMLAVGCPCLLAFKTYLNARAALLWHLFLWFLLPCMRLGIFPFSCDLRLQCKPLRDACVCVCTLLLCKFSLLCCTSCMITVTFGFVCMNLVDPASSHMLVSKIKPCMSQYKLHTVKLRMAHYNSYNLFEGHCLHG